MAVSMAAQEAVWLRALMAELGFPQSGPTALGEDNRGAIALAANDVIHDRSKHIDLHHHCIRELVSSGAVKLHPVPTKLMVADILTKPLSKFSFQKLRDMLMG